MWQPRSQSGSAPAAHADRGNCAAVCGWQPCPPLCYLTDCSPPGSSIQGILQARMLEWVSISSSRGSSQPRDRTRVSCTAGNSLSLSHLGSQDKSTVTPMKPPYLSMMIRVKGPVGLGQGRSESSTRAWRSTPHGQVTTVSDGICAHVHPINSWACRVKLSNARGVEPSR